MFSKIYEPIHFDDVQYIEIKDTGKISWNEIERLFRQTFKPGDPIPVGKKTAQGFEFKLNYLNYYPLLPKVEVELKATEKFQNVSVRQYYDSSARFFQFCWFSAFLVSMLFILLFTFVGAILDFKEYGAVAIGILAPISLGFFCFIALYIGQRIRANLWLKTKEKASELITLIGISDS